MFVPWLSTSHKGYKCLSPNGKLYVSKDVIFNELKYPFNDLFPPLFNSVTSSKSDFLPTAHIPLVSSSLNELSHSSQHAETNSTSVSVDPSRSLNIEFPNSQNVTSSSLSNAEPNSVTDEHSNTVSDLHRNPSELSSTSSSQPHTVSSPSSNFVLPSQNVHPMQTRSKSGIHQSRLHSSLFLAHCEPKTVKQALADRQWLAAMKQEYKALLH